MKGIFLSCGSFTLVLSKCSPFESKFWISKWSAYPLSRAGWGCSWRKLTEWNIENFCLNFIRLYVKSYEELELQELIFPQNQKSEYWEQSEKSPKLISGKIYAREKLHLHTLCKTAAAWNKILLQAKSTIYQYRRKSPKLSKPFSYPDCVFMLDWTQCSNFHSNAKTNGSPFRMVRSNFVMYDDMRRATKNNAFTTTCYVCSLRMKENLLNLLFKAIQDW